MTGFVPIVYFCYPETSNLSLEEVDNLFLPLDQQIQSENFNDVEGRRKGSWGSVGKSKGTEIDQQEKV